MTTLTKAQLNQILSALDSQPRNPNTKDGALKAIGRHGEHLGLSLDDILVAAAGNGCWRTYSSRRPRR